MICLLDTHTLIWALDGDKRLSKKASQTIKAVDNTIYVSVASLWEIAIKRSLKKLDFSLTFEQMYNDLSFMQIGLLPIEKPHLEVLEKLPFHHGDPFDRLIIAQAKSQNIKVITKDKIFPQYKVETLW